MTQQKQNCTKDISLVQADWNKPQSDRRCPLAKFRVDRKFGGQKAQVKLLAETAHEECSQAKATLSVYIDKCGCFEIPIPPYTRALCVTLLVNADKLRGLFSADLDAQCFIRSIHAAPTLQGNGPTVGPAPTGPAPPDGTGRAFKVCRKDGQVLTWTDSELIVDPTREIQYSFFLCGNAPEGAQLTWRSSKPNGTMSVFVHNNAGGVQSWLTDDFHEIQLVTFNYFPITFAEEFEDTITAIITKDGKELCRKSFTVRNRPQQ